MFQDELEEITVPEEILTFKSVSEDQFLEMFNLPKIYYHGTNKDKELDPEMAARMTKLITDDWTLASDSIQTSRYGLFDDGIISTDSVILPYVYFLYALEIGIINNRRFFKNESYLFFPTSTNAYTFSQEHAIQKISIGNIPVIRGIRKALEHLLSFEELTDSRFNKDFDCIMEEEDRDGAIKLLLVLLNQRSVSGMWDRGSRIEKIRPNILY